MMLKIKGKLFLFIICSVIGLNLSAVYANTRTNNDQTSTSAISTAYYKWVKAIETAQGNPKAVIEFYAPNAILLATFSPQLLINKNHGLDHYFISFTSHKNLRCYTRESIIQRYGNLALNTGFYTFTYNEAGKKITVPARFTFVYKKFNNRWLIINHHSSIEPLPKKSTQSKNTRVRESELDPLHTW